MNVLGLVSFRIFPTHMGGQKGVALFYKHLNQYQNVLLAVSKDNQQSTYVKSEKVLYPNKKIYLNLFTFRQLKKVVAENSIDIIIAEHSYTGWIAWVLKRLTGKPFIIHSHNTESKRFKQMHQWWWRLYQTYERWIHRKADYSFFISEEDMQFALHHFSLHHSKCSVITYGIEEITVKETKSIIRKKLGLDENKTLLLFNGTLDYKPNYDAVIAIAENIEPQLRKKISNYQIVITGNRARKNLIERILLNENILFMGYVEDVNAYYQAADLFINPIANDTGIKTKLVEAIANNCTVVSTASGASGIRKDLCGEKLIIAEDDNWQWFVDRVVQCLKNEQTANFTPEKFFGFYNWQNLARIASEKISRIAAHNE